MTAAGLPRLLTVICLLTVRCAHGQVRLIQGLANVMSTVMGSPATSKPFLPVKRSPVMPALVEMSAEAAAPFRRARETELAPEISAPRSSDPLFTDAHLLDFDLDKTLLHGLNLTEKLDKLDHAVKTINLRTTNNEIETTQSKQGTGLREVICRPGGLAPGGCINAADLGRAVGEPLVQWITQSNLYQLQRRIGDVGQSIHDRITRGLTDPLIDTLEFEPTIQALEAAVQSLKKPITILQKDNQYFKAAETVIQEMVLNPANKIDRPPEEKAQLKARLMSLPNTASSSQTTRMQRVACALSNADGCQPTDDDASSVITGIAQGARNKNGFLNHVSVIGFEESCRANGGCLSGSSILNPENFDGIYSFYSVNPDNGLPVYEKNLFAASPAFDDFVHVQRLFLWHDLSTGGMRAAITPQAPTLEHTSLGSKPPYAFHSGTSNSTECLHPQDYPVCVSSTDGAWRFARSMDREEDCSGVSYSGICAFPSKVVIFPYLGNTKLLS